MTAEYWASENGLLIARHTPGLFERWDWPSKGWVKDNDLFDIYLGERDVDPVSESEAMRLIERGPLPRDSRETA